LTNASYYQLFVYDKEGREDRTSVGRVETQYFPLQNIAK
jgi:hypothetical protein